LHLKTTAGSDIDVQEVHRNLGQAVTMKPLACTPAKPAAGRADLFSRDLLGDGNLLSIQIDIDATKKRPRAIAVAPAVG